MKSFNQFIREQEELEELNLRKFVPLAVAASIGAVGGGGLATVGPHIRDAMPTTAISQVRADVANKIGVGSEVPTGTRALTGAGLGAAAAALLAAGVKQRRK